MYLLGEHCVLIKGRHVHKRSMSEIIWRGISFLRRINRYTHVVRNTGTERSTDVPPWTNGTSRRLQATPQQPQLKDDQYLIARDIFLSTVGICVRARENTAPSTPFAFPGVHQGCAGVPRAVEARHVLTRPPSTTAPPNRDFFVCAVFFVRANRPFALNTPSR